MLPLALHRHRKGKEDSFSAIRSGTLYPSLASSWIVKVEVNGYSVMQSTIRRKPTKFYLASAFQWAKTKVKQVEESPP